MTGRGGFIGSHLVEDFQGSAEFIVLDNFRSEFPLNLGGCANTLMNRRESDRAPVDFVMKGVDLIAIILVPESMNAPHKCVETNILGILNVMSSKKTQHRLGVQGRCQSHHHMWQCAGVLGIQISS